MSKTNPRLKFLQSRGPEDLGDIESSGRFSIEVEALPSPRVRLLVHFDGDISELEEKGFTSSTVAGDIASGYIELDKINDLAELDSVVKIESSRPLKSELNVSLPEIGADQIHEMVPGFTGTDVVIGVIDTGIDYKNKCFQQNDATRILAIWDQHITPIGAESSPTDYSYGVEYIKSDIDTALTSPNPHSIVRHRDYDIYYGHGTHVTGIAAGNGSQPGDNKAAGTFVGVAPEADIIMVSNHIETPALGDSAATLDAMKYIFDKAESLGKPAVINLSQGDNLGPHDGTSLLEKGIDNLLVGPGRAVVKSAGNAADDQIHAQGKILQGQSVEVQFIVPPGDDDPDTIDIWYSSGDRFNVSLTVPLSDPSETVVPSSTTSIDLSNGNSAFIDSSLNDPGNGDNRIYIQLTKGTRDYIQQGTWKIILHGLTVVDGEFHAWIERGIKEIPEFTGPYLNNSRTISIPGTSEKVITVGSYGKYYGNPGEFSYFSSLGPTRDNRLKPEISAPGEHIMSVKAYGSGDNWYRPLNGTSMAAPHVSGTIALLFQRDGTLTQAQVKTILMNTAKLDNYTGVVPNNTWGSGKLDAKVAFDSLAQGYQLTINIVGGGVVRKTPNKARYSNENVNLQADPNTGYQFVGWSGDVTGLSQSIDVMMDGDKTVTAEFKNCMLAVLAVGTMLLPFVESLRLFRDGVILNSILKTPFSQTLNLYYKVSPLIVRGINRSNTFRKLMTYFIAYPVILTVNGIKALGEKLYPTLIITISYSRLVELE